MEQIMVKVGWKLAELLKTEAKLQKKTLSETVKDILTDWAIKQAEELGKDKGITAAKDLVSNLLAARKK